MPLRLVHQKGQMLSMAIIEARRASGFAAPGWHDVPTGGSRKSNLYLILKEFISALKGRNVSARGERVARRVKVIFPNFSPPLHLSEE